MNVNWDEFLTRLATYPTGTHRLLPPCPRDRLGDVQAGLGKMPGALVEMLHRFNGAELFDISGPLITIFGLATVPPLPPLEWAADWYIEKFTPSWRSSRMTKNEWVIGIWNYGNLVLLDQEGGAVREWDTAQKRWDPKRCSFEEWIDGVFVEGDTCLREV